MNLELKASADRLGATGTARKSRASKVPNPVQRIVLVFTADESLIEIVSHGLRPVWMVDQCLDPIHAHARLTKPGIGIVVVDDAAIDETTRGWLLDQARRLAPRALIAYVASSHSPEVERSARSHGIQYYIAKPVDPERVKTVLRSFAEAAGLPV